MAAKMTIDERAKQVCSMSRAYLMRLVDWATGPLTIQLAPLQFSPESSMRIHLVEVATLERDRAANLARAAGNGELADLIENGPFAADGGDGFESLAE